jgi:DNA invertase Pin-like site-specific DNA recombinase
MRPDQSAPPRRSPHNATRAAQYLRMSTEHQKYSTENQAIAIAAYAAIRGFQIVRTYQDDGKSGLQLKGRPALKQLLHDARSGESDFGVILVFDVSRWGRFQDADESAYYEFSCKEAGIQVHYCGEPFENDGSLIAALVKSIKRVMAAEYSRELSTKVFAGQCRLISKGFRQGGIAGYGLRRLLVDQQGRRKAILQSGEYKNLTTDRVILVPGPAREVSIVKRIYKQFVSDHLSATRIAKNLNEEHEPYLRGRRWTREGVYGVLRNEKYIGHNVFNRHSGKLDKRQTENPADNWIRVVNAFAPIVDVESFVSVQQLIEERNRQHTETYLLDCLRSLLKREKRLTKTLINVSKRCPPANAYQRHFGSMFEAYKRVGYKRLLFRGRGGRITKTPRSAESRALARKAELQREWRARQKAKAIK